MTSEIKKVLITVKAYPNPSIKYVETVCVAGIDIEKSCWIRMYPVPYRLLEGEKQFKKYSIIEVETFKQERDHRPESYRINTDSIKIIKEIKSTSAGWEERKSFILPTVSKSFCEIYNLIKTEKKSLAVFKPINIDFTFEKAKKVILEKRYSSYSQMSLLNKQLKAIEQIPYNFRYSFFCANERNCPGHSLLIIDWEINQAFRNWKKIYDNESVLLDKIKEKWLGSLCSTKRDSYFYVGNVKRFTSTFMILGVFYPPKI